MNTRNDTDHAQPNGFSSAERLANGMEPGATVSDDDAMGTNIPPAGSPADIAQTQARSFRRLAQTRTPAPSEPRRSTQSGQASLSTNGERDVQSTDQAIARMDNEGGHQPVHARHPSQSKMNDLLSPRSSWWQSEPAIVADVMTKNVKAVDPEAALYDIARIMRSEDVGVVPVVHASGRLLGLVTDRDIVLRGLAGDKSIDELRAKDIATIDIEVGSIQDSLSDIIGLMGRQQIRRVPIVDDSDHLVGIVSLGDIAKRADSDAELQRAFEMISGRKSFWSRIWK